MQHRHLKSSTLTLVAIDDIISRGQRQDWIYLRRAVLTDSVVAGKVVRVCKVHLPDPYAQRYHFWMHYVREHSTWLGVAVDGRRPTTTNSSGSGAR